MSKRVVVAGHICIDITPVFLNDKIKNVMEVFKPGKLIEMGEAKVSTGGAVANTGLAMKYFGANVTLMGKIGCDEFGDLICTILDKYDAGDDMIRSENVTTSYSVVIAIPGVDRMFLHNPGANSNFYSEDIDYNTVKESALFHFGYPTIMESMYENNGEELLTLFKKVNETGCATSLDLSSVDPDSKAGKVDWENILSQVIPYVDFFVPSVEELCFMLDKEKFSEWQNRAAADDITSVLDIDSDVKPLADKCIQMGAKVVLIKCGARGMYLHTGDSNSIGSIGNNLKLDVAEWSDKSIFEKAYMPEKVLSATGAGDTAIAAFLTGVINNENPNECLRLAAATGACCVEAYDALSGLKTFEELKHRIENGWKQVL